VLPVFALMALSVLIVNLTTVILFVHVLPTLVKTALVALNTSTHQTLSMVSVKPLSIIRADVLWAMQDTTVNGLVLDCIIMIIVLVTMFVETEAHVSTVLLPTLSPASVPPVMPTNIVALMFPTLLLVSSFPSSLWSCCSSLLSS